MKNIKIISSINRLNIFHQSPVSTGIWGDYKFDISDGECDGAIVIQPISEKVIIKCPPKMVIGLFSEPPYDYFSWYYSGYKNVNSLIGPNTSKKGKKYILDHGALPWHINKDYDFLSSCDVSNKDKELSFITTANKSFLPGHRDRISFTSLVKDKINVDVIATYEYQLRDARKTGLDTRGKIRKELELQGYTCVEGKWEGLAPYKYSLAIENYSGLYYWTEKLADCFLAWTMPIYYGCTNIDKYFPKESFVQIDINDKHVMMKIKEVIASDLWEKNRDAIEYARNLVLKKYQFFPFVSDYFDKISLAGNNEKKKKITINPARKPSYTLSQIKRFFS